MLTCSVISDALTNICSAKWMSYFCFSCPRIFCCCHPSEPSPEYRQLNQKMIEPKNKELFKGEQKTNEEKFNKFLEKLAGEPIKFVREKPKLNSGKRNSLPNIRGFQFYQNDRYNSD